jgi:hypothetical protein
LDDNTESTVGKSVVFSLQVDTLMGLPVPLNWYHAPGPESPAYVSQADTYIPFSFDPTDTNPSTAKDQALEQSPLSTEEAGGVGVIVVDSSSLGS